MPIYRPAPPPRPTQRPPPRPTTTRPTPRPGNDYDTTNGQQANGYPGQQPTGPTVTEQSCSPGYPATHCPQRAGDGTCHPVSSFTTCNSNVYFFSCLHCNFRNVTPLLVALMVVIANPNRVPQVIQSIIVLQGLQMDNVIL